MVRTYILDILGVLEAGHEEPATDTAVSVGGQCEPIAPLYRRTLLSVGVLHRLTEACGPSQPHNSCRWFSPCFMYFLYQFMAPIGQSGSNSGPRAIPPLLE